MVLQLGRSLAPALAGMLGRGNVMPMTAHDGSMTRSLERSGGNYSRTNLVSNAYSASPNVTQSTEVPRWVFQQVSPVAEQEDVSHECAGRHDRDDEQRTTR
jgi:hypothetical protein